MLLNLINVEAFSTLFSTFKGYLITSSAEFMPEAEDPSDLPCDVDDPSFCFESGTLFSIF